MAAASTLPHEFVTFGRVRHYKMAHQRMLKLQLLLAAIFATKSFGASAGLDGVWRSQGWGFVYEVRGADWQPFEVTSTTCVAGSKAKRVTNGPRGSAATFQ